MLLTNVSIEIIFLVPRIICPIVTNICNFDRHEYQTLVKKHDHWQWGNSCGAGDPPSLEHQVSMGDLVSRFCFFHVILLSCINEFKDILIVARKQYYCIFLFFLEDMFAIYNGMIDKIVATCIYLRKERLHVYKIWKGPTSKIFILWLILMVFFSLSNSL